MKSFLNKLEEFESGVVKLYKPEKGYGFFVSQKGDVFFHITAFHKADVRTGELKFRPLAELDEQPDIHPDTRVRFVRAEGRNGPKAPFWTFERHLTHALHCLDKLPILRLVIITKKELPARADNENKCFIVPTEVSSRPVYFDRSYEKITSMYRYFSAQLESNQSIRIETESNVRIGEFEEIPIDLLL